MEIIIENILFWTGFWMNKILPMVNFCLGMAFQSIIIHRIVSLIHTCIVDHVNHQIENIGK